MAPLLFIAPVAAAVDRALAAAERSGPLLVVGQPRLARALADRGRRVIVALERPRARRRGPPGIVCDPRALPLASRSVAGLVGGGLGDRQDWRELLAEWTRVVADGGAIALVDPGAGRPRASDLTRRALCAGISEIEQRHTGRTVVTSGLVTPWVPVRGGSLA